MGQGSKAGRQFAYRNIPPMVMSTIGSTSEVPRGDRPSAIRHVAVHYYETARKKVQHFNRNRKESIPPKLPASQRQQVASCARVRGSAEKVRGVRNGRVGKSHLGGAGQRGHRRIAGRRGIR